MPAFLPAGAALTAWLRSGPKFERSQLLALWSYRWKGYWFDRNWRLQEILHPTCAFEGDGGRNLLFVLGLWRSGTTLLHELLAAGPGMAAPRTWQCMNPSAFRMAKPPTAQTTISRPMDAISVGALSAQEDEFALLARGAPSAYRAWLDPLRWEEVLPALTQDAWLCLPEREWFVDWRRFLGWCMPAGATTLVIKSPNHVFRLRAIHRAWPNARIVWTLRDPVESWFSNRKMWHAMAALYGLRDWRPADLERLLFNAFAEYATALRWAVDTLGLEHVVFVDFQRLTMATPHVLRSLIRELKLGAWEHWEPLLERRLQMSAQHRRERYPEVPPLPEYARPVIKDIRDLHDWLLRCGSSAQQFGAQSAEVPN